MVDEKSLAAVQRLPEVGMPIKRECEEIYRAIHRADIARIVRLNGRLAPSMAAMEVRRGSSTGNVGHQ